MEVPTDRPVEELSHEELRDEYSQINDELYHTGMPTIEQNEELYERRDEVWAEMKSRVDFEYPECPECGSSRQWSQTPGDPKMCGECGHEVADPEVVEAIDEAWDTILHGN